MTSTRHALTVTATVGYFMSCALFPVPQRRIQFQRVPFIDQRVVAFLLSFHVSPRSFVADNLRQEDRDKLRRRRGQEQGRDREQIKNQSINQSINQYWYWFTGIY